MSEVEPIGELQKIRKTDQVANEQKPQMAGPTKEVSKQSNSSRAIGGLSMQTKSLVARLLQQKSNGQNKAVEEAKAQSKVAPKADASKISMKQKWLIAQSQK